MMSHDVIYVSEFVGFIVFVLLFGKTAAVHYDMGLILVSSLCKDRTF